MTKDFLEKKVTELSKLGGYEKPPKISGSLKLDSNENFVINKLFQQDLIDVAKKKCDVREYPLGGTEKLINHLSKFLKVPVNMIGVGNGSDQILDLFLANFCTRQTKILTTNPTFAFFEERCKLYRIPMIRVPFSDKMTIDVDDFLTKARNVDLIYIDLINFREVMRCLFLAPALIIGIMLGRHNIVRNYVNKNLKKIVLIICFISALIVLGQALI